MKIIIAGDFAPKHELYDIISKGDYSSIFKDVSPLVKVADVAVVNFEASIADNSCRPIDKCGPNIKAPINSSAALEYAGFNVVTLANNHFYDFGQNGVEISLKSFVKHNLKYVGGGISLDEASKTLYMNVKGKRLAIINCCEHEFTIATSDHGGSNPLDPMRQYYAISEAKQNADYVLVIVHGGHEHFRLPSLRMQDTYRFFIDAGANCVVNHHQHCFSGVEYYKECPIFYGLGNFLFDTHNASYTRKWNEGYMVCIDITVKGVKYDLIPYIQCVDGDYSIKLINSDEEKQKFYDKLESLNKIISSRNILEKKNNEYFLSQNKNSLMPFEPYGGRLLKAAYIRNYLPSFIKGKKLLNFLNKIDCESHLDILRYNIRHLTNK